MCPSVMAIVISPRVVVIHEDITTAKEDHAIGGSVVRESVRVPARRTHDWRRVSPSVGEIIVHPGAVGLDQGQK